MRTLCSNFKMFKRIWKINNKFIIFKLIISVLGSALPLLSNILILNTLNIATEGYEFTSFLRILLLYAVYNIVYSFISVIYNNVYNEIYIEEIKMDILDELYRKSRSIWIYNFDNHEFFNKYNFILQNCVNSSIKVVELIINLISSLSSIILLSILVISIEKKILIFAISSSVITFFISLKIANFSYTIKRKINQEQRKISYVERIYYIKKYAKDLRVTNLSKKLKKLYSGSKDNIVAIYKQFGFKLGILYFIQNIFQIFNTLLTILYLAYKLFNKIIFAGEFAATFNSYGQITQNISQILHIFPQFYENSLFINDYLEFLKIEEEEDNENEKNSLESFESLSIKNLDFTYPNNNIKTLKEISITINKGEKIALVGKNGAGKSSIVNIIQGLYKTQEHIYINNHHINNYKRKDINKMIGIIPQDYNMYAFSIQDNITLNTNQKVNENDSFKLLKELGLEEKIKNLKQAVFVNIVVVFSFLHNIYLRSRFAIDMEPLPTWFNYLKAYG